MDVTFDPTADGAAQSRASGVHARDCDCAECRYLDARAEQEYYEGLADADRLFAGNEDEGDEDNG